MKRTITISHMSNMKAVTFEMEARLWEKGDKKRWYISAGKSQFCLDANTGEQVKTHGQVNNPHWIAQAREQLGL